MFDKGRYCRFLKTRRLGRVLETLKQVDSTNNWIANRLGREDIEQVVAVAELQTAGRGRYGRNWTSPPGVNLAFSLAVKIPESLDPASVLTLTAGVSLAETVGSMAPVEPGLKYPNDLMINSKKVAGILAEFKKGGDRDYAVVGIGINVNTRVEMFPDNLHDTATSLLMESGHETSREALLAMFLFQFESRMYELEADGPKSTIQQFRRLAAPYFGKQVTIDGAGEKVAGAMIDIADNGGLVIETAPGVTKTVISGEARFRPCPLATNNRPTGANIASHTE